MYTCNLEERETFYFQKAIDKLSFKSFQVSPSITILLCTMFLVVFYFYVDLNLVSCLDI